MSVSGRSMDDLPLAAYGRGIVEPDEDVPETPSYAAVTQPESVAPAPADGPFELDTYGEPTAHPGATGSAVIRVPRPGLGRARALARTNPRLVAGGGFVAMILVGLLLLGGGKPAPSAAGAVASPGAPTAVPVAVDPGAATLVLTGAVKGTYTFTGTAGQPAGGPSLAASWVDTLQNVLTLDGPVDRGTRMTDAGFVLTWGLMLDGKLVTFTSKAGECTIGMASTIHGVTGSFACKKLKSDDGKLTVGATGTYRT